MVEETRRRLSPDRVDHYLGIVADDARSLARLEERWSEEDPRNKHVYAAEWLNAMGMAGLLEQAFWAGALSPSQQARYRELKALLEESVPVLKRLGFTLPPVPLDGRE